jgi:hypothetical protein
MLKTSRRPNLSSCNIAVVNNCGSTVVSQVGYRVRRLSFVVYCRIASIGFEDGD